MTMAAATTTDAADEDEGVMNISVHNAVTANNSDSLIRGGFRCFFGARLHQIVQLFSLQKLLRSSSRLFKVVATVWNFPLGGNVNDNRNSSDSSSSSSIVTKKTQRGTEVGVDPAVFLGQHLFLYVTKFLAPQQQLDVHVPVVGEEGGVGGVDHGHGLHHNGDNDGVSIQQAEQFHRNLALVSVGWKKILDENLNKILPPLCVDLDNNEEKKIAWLLRYKLALQDLQGVFPVSSSAERLTNLLTVCDTTELTTLKLTLVAQTTNRSEQFQSALKSQKQFQTLVRTECPKLKFLILELILSGDFHERELSQQLMNDDLFTAPSIRSLAIELPDYSPFAIHTTFVSQMIERFPSLKSMGIACSKDTVLRKTSESLSIKSKTLECLMLPTFCQSINIALDCPELKVYHCSGTVSWMDNVQPTIHNGQLLPPVLIRQNIRSSSNRDDNNERGGHDERNINTAAATSTNNDADVVVGDGCVALVEIEDWDGNYLPGKDLRVEFSYMLDPSVRLYPLSSHPRHREEERGVDV